MPIIHPHINFNGNAEEAFLFYQSVFGGAFSKLIRFKDLSNEAFPIPEEEAEKIMHIALPIGPNFLMGNDVPSFLGQVNERENRSKIVIHPESREEAQQLFEKLALNGTVEVPIDENEVNAFFVLFRDQFGIEWMIDFQPKK